MGSEAVTLKRDQAVTFAGLCTVGAELWVGGEFTVKGDTSTLNLIRGNGSVWTGFGNKIGPVRDFAVSRTDVFVIETFRTSARIDTQTVQRWNGSSWSRVDLDFPKFEFTRLVTDSQNVFLFGTGLNDLRLHVFKWKDTRFVPILAGNCFGTASAVEVRGNRIILGGQFSGIDGVRADNLAVWNGSAWKGLTLGIGPGPSMNGEVMASNGEALFLGGRNIRWLGKQPVSGIGRFDGLASEGMAGGNLFGLGVEAGTTQSWSRGGDYLGGSVYGEGYLGTVTTHAGGGYQYGWGAYSGASGGFIEAKALGASWSNRGHKWGLDGYQMQFATAHFNGSGYTGATNFGSQIKGQIADLKQASIAPFTAAGLVYGLAAMATDLANSHIKVGENGFDIVTSHNWGPGGGGAITLGYSRTYTWGGKGPGVIVTSPYTNRAIDLGKHEGYHTGQWEEQGAGFGIDWVKQKCWNGCELERAADYY